MYWIYDIPRWGGTLLFAVVFVGFTWLGLLLIRPWVRRHAADQPDWDPLIGAILAAFVVFYGISLALIGVYGNATGAFNQTGDQIGTDPKLGALLDNGGPTQTHALLAGSPAIDKGNTDLTTDQRGEVRPFDDPTIAPATGGDNSDIGSFEAQSVLNSAPEATDDAYSTNEDTTLTEPAPGVLTNDEDADDDPLTAEVVDDVDNGTLTLNSDGSFTYTPNANFSGSDSFTYKANDGTADSGVATVSISVRAADDAPSVRVAQGGSCGSASDMRGTINLALSDPDPIATSPSVGAQTPLAP